MNFAFHLVLVSEIAAPRVEKDGGPKPFFAQKFPKSLIDEFFFLDNPSESERLLYQRSIALLEQLRNSRGSSSFPIIFLAHGIGGFIVKQALKSATEEPLYRDIALYTTSILFFDVSHATRQKAWEHLWVRFLSSLPGYPPKLVAHLLEELEDISRSFRTISCSFDVVDFYESSQHPVLEDRCSILGKQDETKLSFEGRHEQFWTSDSGKFIAEKARKQILASRTSRNFLLHDFFRVLSLLDSHTHQLKPIFVAPLSLDRVCDNEEIKSWKSDPLVGILRVSGLPGSGTTAIAAQILGSLLDQMELQKLVCLSFTFSKSNFRARDPFSLYLSLCRQVLSSRPELFQHVSSISNFLSKNGTLTAETLWVIFRCLMSNLLDQKDTLVYCVIDAVDECMISQTEMIQRMEGFVGLANNRFKLLFTGTNLPRPSSESDRYRSIILELNGEGMVSFKKQYVQDKIREFALENSAWHGLEDVALDQLDALPAESPYLLTKLNLLLLERTCKHSTRRDLKRKLREQPTTLEGFYTHAMATIDDANRNWVTMALCWVSYAVRPMRPTELAVAVALDDIPGGPHWESDVSKDIDDLIRRNIMGDLKHFIAPLINLEDNRIFLIHDTFRAFLETAFTQILPVKECPTSAQKDASTQAGTAQDNPAQPNSILDAHYRILFHCLEYLKSFGQRGSAFIMGKDGTQCSLPSDGEFSLLSYASLHWPQHFLETTSRSAACEFVMKFLQDDKRVDIWTNLYHQLKPSPKSNIIRLDVPLKIVCNFGLIDLVDDCIKLVESSEDFNDQVQKALDLAAQNGHNDVVQKLLNKNVRSSEALGLAAAGGFERVVKNLIGVGTDINKPDETGYAPLHHATCGGHKNIVLLLLKNNAEINVPTSPPPDQQSSISRRRSHDRRFRSRILYSGSDSEMNDMDSSLSEMETFPLSCHLWSETSLHLAALTGQYEMAKILLRNGANVSKENSSGYDPFKYAAIGGSPEMLILLRQPNVNGEYNGDGDKMPNSDGNTALHLAAAYGHLKAAEIILQNRDDASKLVDTINSRDLSPIDLAAREGHLSLLNLMLDVQNSNKNVESIARGRIDDQRPSPTVSAIKGNLLSNNRLPNLKRLNRRSTIELSPERKSQVSFATSTPLEISKGHRKLALEWAAEYGHGPIVHAILARNGRIEPEGQAFSLHLAAKNGHTNIVETFLNDNLTRIAIDVRGNTALHLAAKGGHSEILAALLIHSPVTKLFQVDATEQRGMTPLHLAAQAGHEEIVSILLSQKATIDLADNESKTALHFAAENGHLAVVKRLCAFEEIIWKEDVNNLTAFDHMVNRDDIKGVEEFIKILEGTTTYGEKFVRGGTPLHNVVQRKNIDILRLLLEKGWKCDVEDNYGTTPLHKAVEWAFLQGIEVIRQNPLGDINSLNTNGYTVMHRVRTPEIANHLLAAGAKNDVKDVFERTPLYLAVYRGNLGVVKALLDSTPKPDVHTKDEDDWNLLHAAYDSRSITELLLKPENRVKLDSLNNSGRTPLALAIQRDYQETAKLLLKAGADPCLARNFEDSPLYFAMEKQNALELMQLLVDYIKTTETSDIQASVLCKCVSMSSFEPGLAEIIVGQSLDVNTPTELYFTALHAACSKGSISAVNWLLGKNSSVNAPYGKHGTPLCAAVESETDSEEKVRRLLGEGADIDFFDKSQPTALQIAISKGNAILVNLLLAKGANVNLTGGNLDTPLNASILGGIDLANIDIMLKNGADISKPGVGGLLPVHAAAKSGRSDILNAVIAAGAEGRSKDSGGRSVLMHGVLSRNPDAVGWLLEHIAFKMSEVDSKGQTPLIIATVLGYDSIVSMLLESGQISLETLNAQDYELKTALVHATSLDHLEIVKKLLSSDADPRIVDCRNRGPLYWAARAARMETLKKIIGALEKYDDHIMKSCNIALHGAVASNKQTALIKLLEKEDVDVEYPGPDSWTPLYTATRYDSHRIKGILKEAGVAPLVTLHLKIPSCWHPNDRFPGLELGSDGTTLRTIGGTKFENLGHPETRYGAARTDYPMLPLLKEVFYFEIKIIKVAEEGFLAIGFCDDKAPLNSSLGWDAGSWGFHSVDGWLFGEGKQELKAGGYSKPYFKGEVIGCGVNFAKNSAFYTREGKVIGRAFEDIRGKLYPAVSMDIIQEGWEIKAVFPDSKGESDHFMFRGDYDSNETLEPPTTKSSTENGDSTSDNDSGSEIVASD